MKTPIKELNEDVIFKLIRGKCISDESALSVTKDIVGMINYSLTKEKEQREELIKEVCIKTHLDVQNSSIIKIDNILKALKKPTGIFEASKGSAEQYYNEVIKVK